MSAAAAVPETLFDDPVAEARWRARFTAPRVSLPDWARDAPDRCLYTSNASGTWEVYAWDRSTGTHRQVTERPRERGGERPEVEERRRIDGQHGSLTMVGRPRLLYPAAMQGKTGSGGVTSPRG